MKVHHALWVVIFLLFFSRLTFANEELIIGADQWPPFTDENKSDYGVCFALTKSAFSMVNYSITKQIMPAKRLMNHTESLRVDAICNLWYTEKRSENYLFSKPYLYNSVHFWILSDRNIEYTTLEDLKDFKIGIVSGYYNGEAFDSADYLNKIIVQESSENMIRLLINKRIDIAVCDNIVAENIIRKTGITGKLKYLPKTLFKAGLHLAVSRTHPDADKIITSFNQGIHGIKENGTYQNILSSCGLTLNEVDPELKP